MTIQMSIIGPDGILKITSSGPALKSNDHSDREYFRFQKNALVDQLFIGRPEAEQGLDYKPTRLARRLRNPDDSFGGVIVALLDPKDFSRFYQSIDVGADGLISLVGTDGIIRANAGAKEDIIGKSLANTPMVRFYRQKSANFYFTPGIIEPIGRFVAYRKVAGFPLIVTAALAESEVLGRYWQNRRSYAAIGAGLTVLILIGVGLGVRHRNRIDAVRRALQLSESRAREKSRELGVTLEHMSQGIMMIDQNNNVVVINRRALELLGLPERFLTSRPDFSEIIAFQRERGEFGSDGNALPDDVRQAFARGEPGGEIGSFERIRPNGIVLEIVSSQLADGGVVRTFTDVTERKRNMAQIAHMARHDSLTGLANRALLRERLEIAMGRSRRLEERFAIVCLDLDRFKAVNDTLGHSAGDELLRLVAERLRHCVRATDTVARLGGDEFALLVAVQENVGSTAALAQRILEVIRAPYDLNGGTVEIGTSIGISLAPDEGVDLEELLRKADIALYRVKTEGRNAFRFFEPEMELQVQARRLLENELRAALQRDELELYYQPIYQLVPERICGLEAVLRWNHPDRGVLLPAEFLGFAEEIGLIIPIGEWAVHCACAEATNWPPNIKVAVNLSRAQFKGQQLIDLVADALARSGLPPHRLHLEVNETVFLDPGIESFSVLQKLRNLEVALVLDNFGTGYSALSNLRKFHFDKIKIDRSLVAELSMGSDGIAIVVAIAGLARNLGGATAAEGVETEEQVDLLAMAGCTEAQGNVFGQPRRAVDVLELFAASPAKVDDVV
jgi:diguanylate cyclase (GGDEF)-like protein